MSVVIKVIRYEHMVDLLDHCFHLTNRLVTTYVFLYVHETYIYIYIYVCGAFDIYIYMYIIRTFSHIKYFILIAPVHRVFDIHFSNRDTGVLRGEQRNSLGGGVSSYWTGMGSAIV